MDVFSQSSKILSQEVAIIYLSKLCDNLVLRRLKIYLVQRFFFNLPVYLFSLLKYRRIKNKDTFYYLEKKTSLQNKTCYCIEVLLFANNKLQFFGIIQVSIHIMAIGVVDFSNGGYKIRKIFAYESTYSKEIIEF